MPGMQGGCEEHGVCISVSILCSFMLRVCDQDYLKKHSLNFLEGICFCSGDIQLDTGGFAPFVKGCKAFNI